MKHPSWKSELIGLWETFMTDPYILALFPMFFASNWFYNYHFTEINAAYFNVRTRALNGVVYYMMQIVGAYVFGLFTIGVSDMVMVDGTHMAPSSQNPNWFGASLALFKYA